MVENLHLERINAVMQAGRGKYDEPFGGVQVILIGDFFQLPPVKPFQHCAYCGSPFRTDWEDGEDSEDTVVNYTCDSCKDFIMYRESDKWTFQSQVWEQCKFRHIELTTAHRQKDNAFVSLLQKCRKSIPFSQDEIDVLMNHPSDTKGAVKLFSTRAEVRQTNTAEFAKLSSVARCYTCHDQFVGEHIYNTARFREDENGSLKYFGRDHRFEKTIELILKMQVVLLANLNLRKGLCNGSQGVVVDFEAYDEEKLPRKSLDGTLAEAWSASTHHSWRHRSERSPGSNSIERTSPADPAFTFSTDQQAGATLESVLEPSTQFAASRRLESQMRMHLSAAPRSRLWPLGR